MWLWQLAVCDTNGAVAVVIVDSVVGAVVVALIAVIGFAAITVVVFAVDVIVVVVCVTVVIVKRPLREKQLDDCYPVVRFILVVD